MFHVSTLKRLGVYSNEMNILNVMLYVWFLFNVSGWLFFLESMKNLFFGLLTHMMFFAGQL